MIKDMPKEVEEYYKNGEQKAVSVSANNDYTIVITYANGQKRLYDLSKQIANEKTVFAVLKDINIFTRAYVDKFGAIAWDIDQNVDSEEVWENKIDICADNCYIYGKVVGERK